MRKEAYYAFQHCDRLNGLRTWRTGPKALKHGAKQSIIDKLSWSVYGDRLTTLQIQQFYHTRKAATNGFATRNIQRVKNSLSPVRWKAGVRGRPSVTSPPACQVDQILSHCVRYRVNSFCNKKYYARCMKGHMDMDDFNGQKFTRFFILLAV